MKEMFLNSQSKTMESAFAGNIRAKRALSTVGRLTRAKQTLCPRELDENDDFKTERMPDRRS